jgi:fluoride exporter
VADQLASPSVTALTWVAVAAVGGCGAVARFLFDGFVGTRLGKSLPFGTFAVNISGAFLLGLLDGLALSGNTMLIAGTATIGAYTTFSTWMLETQRLAEERQHGKAVLNVVASLALGIGAAALGQLIGGHL